MDFYGTYHQLHAKGILLRKPEGKRTLGRQGVGGRIILKCLLKIIEGEGAHSI
jgi:hypothetical protein